MKKTLPRIVIGALILFISSCTKEILKDIIPKEPIANFSYSGQPVTGSIISFTNSSSDATSYSWDFGDPTSPSGNTSTDANPQHIFTTANDFTVTLTASGQGGTNIISKTLHVQSQCRIVEEVGSSIDVATTWQSCHIYHCANFVTVNAALTIEAGAIVKFDALKGITVMGSGKITANGSSTNPVIFTSSKDDNFYGSDNNGGDTNGDGTGTIPQKGDWHWITFGTSSGNSLDYCKILYAGSGTTNLERALNMGDGANNSLTNSVIAHTSGGINQSYAALDMSYCPQSCVAQNNTFFDNGHPVIIGISTDFDNSNTFHNPDNVAQTNVCNGIFVDVVHAPDQAALMTWSETEVAFVLGGWSSNSWAMDGGLGKKLVLGDNVVIKFVRSTTPGFSLLMPDGSVQLQNYNGPGVAFTAYTDDSLKGDTNGDGPSSGTAGYWEGIYMAGPVWFTWSNIHFAAH
jgi:PKD repeat protein